MGIVEATYVGGSDSNQIKFSYTIQSTDKLTRTYRYKNLNYINGDFKQFSNMSLPVGQNVGVEVIPSVVQSNRYAFDYSDLMPGPSGFGTGYIGTGTPMSLTLDDSSSQLKSIMTVNVHNLSDYNANSKYLLIRSYDSVYDAGKYFFQYTTYVRPTSNSIFYIGLLINESGTLHNYMIPASVNVGDVISNMVEITNNSVSFYHDIYGTGSSDWINRTPAIFQYHVGNVYIFSKMASCGDMIINLQVTKPFFSNSGKAIPVPIDALPWSH